MPKAASKLVSRKEVRRADSQEDVRRERTRSRLKKVVLQLARQGDISSTPISEVSRRAGIYRTTFYSHAETPMEFLIKILREDLDEIRSKTISEGRGKGTVSHELAHMRLSDLVDHVIEHEDIYGWPDCASSTFALRTVLASHIEESFRGVLSDGLVMTPSKRSEDTAMYSGYFAHGITGAIAAWLRLPKPRDRASLMDAIEAMYPPWFAPARKRQARVRKEA